MCSSDLPTRELVGKAQEKIVAVTVDRDVLTPPDHGSFQKIELRGERVLEITYRKDEVNAGQVLAACEAQPDASFDGASFTWVTLGALRLHYTAFTGDVTSKRGAGEYGLALLPASLTATVEDALALRAAAEHGEVGTDTMFAAADVIDWVVDEVMSATHPQHRHR